jgi:SET domain
MLSPYSYPTINLAYIRENLRKSMYIYIADTSQYGLGIFAAKRFINDDKIISDSSGRYFDGALSLNQVGALGLDLSRDCFQIDDDLFLLPTGSIDDLINHSCRPNTGIRFTDQGYDLVALRDIDVGEELTYDYSTYIESPERLSCSCGTVSCRGEIGRFRELPPRLRAYYLARGVVGAFAAGRAAKADRPARLGAAG